MDSSTNPTGQFLQFIRTHFRRLGWIGLGLCFAGYGIFLGSHLAAYASGADSSGYMNSARLLSKGDWQVPRRTIDNSPEFNPLAEKGNYAFVPLGFRPERDGEMVPTYPIGLPLMIAAGSVFGWTAAPGVTLLAHALLALVLFFALARIWGLPRGWAAFGALILGASPLFMMFSIQTMSDVPALTWTLAAILAAWQSRRKPWIALAAGAAVGLAVLIRPSNLLIILPILVVLGTRWKQWLLLGLGGIPFALLFLGYNRAAYGNPFETGYGGVLEMLSPRWIKPTLENYVRWLPPLLTPLALLGLATPAVRKLSLTIRATLVLWFLSFFSFYAFYPPTHEAWWYLRFTLPAFPGILLGALLVAFNLTQRWQIKLFDVRGSLTLLIVSAALIGGVIFNSTHWSKKLLPFSAENDERQYVDASIWAGANIPVNAVVASLQLSGALFFYTDLAIVRWDTLSDPDRAAGVEAVRRSGRPFYLVDLDSEADRARQLDFSGSWTQIQRIRNACIFVWKDSSAAPAAAATR